MLNELGNLGDFIGGLAVVLSLIYLATQIRQNTATVRVQTVQHLLTSDTSAADSLIEGPMPQVLGKLAAGDELSSSEIAAYTLYLRGRLTEAWQVLYQRQNGMIEAEVADALLRRLESDLGYGLFRAVWNHRIKTRVSSRTTSKADWWPPGRHETPGAIRRETRLRASCGSQPLSWASMSRPPRGPGSPRSAVSVGVTAVVAWSLHPGCRQAAGSWPCRLPIRQVSEWMA